MLRAACRPLAQNRLGLATDSAMTTTIIVAAIGMTEIAVGHQARTFNTVTAVIVPVWTLRLLLPLPVRKCFKTQR